ncbi:MAG: hydroxymethylpyrimidine/phosphomethylpyrimidine kinase [Candidatus Sulfotelmatobacter sp.]|jgi:hydroxymethylpyrimidine/phosphomethylpyrimidine kinase
MPEKPPIVLTIAGFDPSSGAGVTADIKTIAAHACYGVACITALTVQSTSGVKRVQAVDPSLISDTLEELAADLDIAAVHIGMLGSAKVVKAVADFLSSQKGSRPSGKSRLPNIVLDPILKSSSGADLLDPAGTRLLIERLIPLADVVTPNVDEAAALTGLKVTDLDEMKAAAAKLHAMGSSAVVITGGHLEKATDLLSFTTKRGSPEMTGSSHQQEEPGIEAELGKGMEPQFEQEVFKAERQRSNSTHGTGCAFATAMACHLALDRGLAEAALLAKTYVTAAITNAHPLGRGTGPVHHLYRMSQQRRAAGSGSEQS